MKKPSLTAAAFALALCQMHPAAAQSAPRPVTFCNPIDLPYRFSLEDNKYAKGAIYREAADATMVFHEGTYWLFASKIGGYYHSKDLVHWEFIVPTGYPTEEYAPSVCIVGGKWLMTPSIGKALYTSDDPATGQWTKLRNFPYYPDPEMYVDDDGRLYFYWGSSPDKPIMGVELDPKKNFDPIGQPTPLIPGLDTINHGWEARNQKGTDEQIRNAGYKPWMEGATMIKKDGVYYLQYSAPGTEMPEYADGIYTAKSPLGPYTYAPYSPFSYKPSGFVTSAGHGSTFKGNAGRSWRVVSQLIGVNHMFERRLGIYPVGFYPNGSEPAQITADTYLGDYPQLAPGLVKDPFDHLAGWMLLSLKKQATASSSLDDKHQAKNAFDENIRTSWAAATGDAGEFLSVDFGKPSRIDAVQVNFADVNAKAYGFVKDAYRYTIEVSNDGKTWKPLVDRKENQRDAPHEYVQLPSPVTARYAKLTNIHTPGGAVFSVSDLRFFGSGLGKAPEQVADIKAERQTNRRLMNVSWKKTPGAEFYIVRYGIKPDRLTLNWQVYDGESVTIPGLNTDQEYSVTVDSISDNGVARGPEAKPAH